MKKAVIILLLFGIMTTVHAQNLSEMPEKTRNEKLVKEAKKAIKEYAPDYVRYTDGKYLIEFRGKDISAGFNDPLYSVRFTDYDHDEEFFKYGYAVGVDFREEDGNIESIFNGQGWGILIHEQLSKGEKVNKLEYKKHPPFKINSNGPIEIY